MKSFLTTISKYVLSILLFLAALVALLMYLVVGGSKTQDSEVLIGILVLFLCAIVSLPALLQKLGKSLSYVLVLVFLGLAAYLAYLNYNSIDKELAFTEKKAKVESTVIRRLKDIRTAQEEYVKVYGKYANNFDSLHQFIVEPKIPVPFKAGNIANNDTILELPPEEQLKYIVDRDNLGELGMTVEQAVKAGYEVRDTTYASLFDQKFGADYRKKVGLPLVDLDSLFYSPTSGQKFILKTGSMSVSGVQRPTILVKDPTPIHKEREVADTLAFGSLDDVITNGNWGSR